MLAPDLHPRTFEIGMPVNPALLEAAEHELMNHAFRNIDGCWAYVPAMEGEPGIDNDLPANKSLAEAWPNIEIEGRSYDFNFTRLSIRRQPNPHGLHVDTDAATGATGDPDTLGKREVWRVLPNLSGMLERVFAYADVDVSEVRLERDGKYLYCPDSIKPYERRIVLPPRTEHEVHALLFCSSRILHAGIDGKFGHFVAGYGREESA